MRLLTILGLLGGLILTVGLVLSQGAGDVWRTGAMLGWSGFFALITLRIVMTSGMGFAWWGLKPEMAPGHFVWARLLRDAAGDTLPMSQVCGYVVGVRAAALAGVAWPVAAATTVVDVTLELIAQLAYVAIGLALLAWLRPGAAVVWPAFLAVAGMVGFVTLFVTFQARSAGMLERLSRRLTQAWLGERSAPLNDVQAIIAALYRCPSRCPLSAALHLGCWVLSGLAPEKWRALSVRDEVSDARTKEALHAGVP